MSKKRSRKLRRRPRKRQQRASAARENAKLSFEQLEARQMLATLVVNSTADLPVDLTDSQITLRDAIHAANTDALVAPGGTSGSGADTITFDASVFTGTQPINITSQLPTITDALTITGPGADMLTIDAGNGTDNIIDTGDGYRIFEINDGIAGSLIDVGISGLTLTGGDIGGNGGAILNAESLTLTDSVLDNNHATSQGGGINSSANLILNRSTVSGNTSGGGGGINSSANLILNRSTVSGNTSGTGGGINIWGNLILNRSTVSGNTSGDGGGIHIVFGDLAVTDSTISGNSSFNRGGGITSLIGHLTVTGSTISGNSAGNNGGGIYNAGTAAVNSSMLSGNSSSGSSSSFPFKTGSGGGIFNGSGIMTVTSSTLSGNSSLNNGGGIYNAANLTVANSTLYGNTVLDSYGVGGGIYNHSDGNVIVTGSTLSENSAENRGGGIHNGGNLTVTSSTLFGNFLRDDTGSFYDFLFTGSSILNEGTATLNGSIVAGGSTRRAVFGAFSGSHNIIQYREFVRPPIGLSNTIFVDPLLGLLADNGGPTLTHALLPGSPAIDAGDIGIVDPPMFDQRGAPFLRIVDGNIPTDVVIDIGAIEYTPNVSQPPSIMLNRVDEGGVLRRPDLWNTLTVAFDRDVSITANALSLINDTLGGTIVDLSGVTFEYNSTTFEATWKFDAANPLPAAYYTYRLDASSITAGGFQLDANGDGIGGDDLVAQHYVAIPGDANLDGQVDILIDAFALVGNLRSMSGATWAQGDFNGDRNVNVLGDAFTLVGNLGQSVIPPVMAQVSTLLEATLAPVQQTPAVPLTAVIVDQAEDDEDELVAVVPREVAEAASPELSGDQARDAAFESEFASADSFWG